MRLKHLVFALCFLFAALLLDRLYPVSLSASPREYARVIVAENGTPLRAFADLNGVWRYPVTLNQVSPLYIEALINYEDRWFRYHPGINPFALIRALIQNISNNRIVSGGSTLTMQVARLIKPHPRSITGKLQQLFRALQLDWHYSKQDILNYYLNHAPFGGPLEGVQAASYAYLGKPSAELSHAEAALLAVLPQAPSRHRPDRHPEKARQARDKVLRRLEQLSVWPLPQIKEAFMETVSAQWHAQPVIAPLLARRLKPRVRKSQPLQTTIDINMQLAIEDLVRNYVAMLPEKTSAAVLIVDNRTRDVKAYVGSADFSDKDRFGHVDMIQAIRSPGSTLKPFLYGLALDEGLIHSESLLTDAPVMFAGYRPRNFSRGFSGPVSVRHALIRSLNVPAIQVLHHLGPGKFVARLKNAGLKLNFPPGTAANLSVILGGTGTSLESLVENYSAFANAGRSGKLRFIQEDPVLQRHMLSPGSAWIIRQLLTRNKRRDDSLAWKTGTSYGYRDFWSIGINNGFTIGVWIGRPDGTPTPGHYGSRSATPLLFSIADHVSGYRTHNAPKQPHSVRQQMICWPLGGLMSETPETLCHEKKPAWILNETVPRTLPDETDFHWAGNTATLLINRKSGRPVDATCAATDTMQKIVAFWPTAVEPWIPEARQRHFQMGSTDTSCAKPPQLGHGKLTLQGLDNNAILRPVGASAILPKINLKASGGQGTLYWFINGRLLYRAREQQAISHRFNTAGQQQIAVTDDAGNTASVAIRVLPGSKQ